MIDFRASANVHSAHHHASHEDFHRRRVRARPGREPLGRLALATVAQLIRRLNDALDCASIVVSHDIKDAFAIADHVFLLAGGRIAAQGTPDEMKASEDPNVRQFLEGDIDGPIAFHFQAKPLAEDLGLGA